MLQENNHKHWPRPLILKIKTDPKILKRRSVSWLIRYNGMTLQEAKEFKGGQRSQKKEIRIESK